MSQKDDTISRQAAIDALKRAEVLTKAFGYHNVIDTIRELPSAEPEQRWIPCEERLPENRVYVLVTYRYEYGLIDHGITWYGEAEKKWNTSREIIAWKPLPEPWKGEQPC